MSEHGTRESLAVNDGELLSRFVFTGDQQAFSQIVTRPLVKIEDAAPPAW